MKKFFTRNFAFAALFALGLMNSFAIGPMKDIELDPEKTEDVGNKMFVTSDYTTMEAYITFHFETEGNVTARVFDVRGAEASPASSGYVGALRTNQCVVDLNTLQNGVYFITLTHANGTTLTQKILVAR